MTPNPPGKSSATSLLLSILVMLGMLIFFFNYPARVQTIMTGFFWGVFGLGMLLFAFALGALAWQKHSPESFKHSGITISHKPSLGLVGSEGVGSGLRIIETPEMISVAWSSMSYIFILFTTFAFGPVLIAGFTTHQQSTKTPPLFVAIMIVICSISAATFFSTLYKLIWRYPKLLIKTNRIEFWRGRHLEKKFWGHDIETLSIEDHAYEYTSRNGGDTHTHTNYILTMHLKHGLSERLCICDNRAQIEGLKRSIETKMRLTA